MSKSDVLNQPGSPKFTAFAWGVLIYNFAVVLWGAFVRATGSGAGCGNHWPLCNGEVTPRTPQAATLIEFTHRVMSGLDLVLVAALVILAFRLFPAKHPVRLGAMLSGVFLIAEAGIGAGLVLLEHVAQNDTPNRAWWLSAHLLNTMALLACLALTAWWAGGRPGLRARGKELWLAVASVALFLVLGVSGAIAALGDTLFPARSLGQGLALDFSPTAHVLLRLRLWHPVLAAITGLWLAFYCIWSIRRRPETRLGTGILLSFVSMQMAAGLMTMFLLAPVGMQLLHLLLADVVWIALVLHCATMLAAGKPQAVPKAWGR